MDWELDESNNESLPPTLDKEESDSSSDKNLNEPLSNLITWAKRDLQNEVPDVEESFELEQQLTKNDSLSVLHRVFTTELVEMIVHQSNLFATFKNIHISNPMTVDDYWLILGVIIYMACVDLPGIEYY